MKLYLIQQCRVAAYDEAEAFVIRAASPHAARKMASLQCGREGPEMWMDTNQSSCKELLADGEPGIIIRDFYEA